MDKDILINHLLANAFNEHEYFSLDDVMAITGESREEVYYFPNGLH